MRHSTINLSSFSFFAGGLLSYLGVIDTKKYTLSLLDKMKVNFVNLGDQEIIPGHPYLMVSNHRSATDPVLLYGHVLKNQISPFSFMTKKKIPFGPILKKMSEIENIPIFFKDDPYVLKSVLKLLKTKSSFLIFPEGTRNKTNLPLLPFQKGVDFLLKHASHHDLILYYLERPEDLLRGKKNINVYYLIIDRADFINDAHFSVEKTYYQKMPLNVIETIY